jgi:hypothetical protein
MSIFDKLGLPLNTVCAIRLLRVNGRIVVHDRMTREMLEEPGADRTKFCEPENGVPKNSYYVRLLSDQLVSIVSRTMRGGEVAHNFDCVVDVNGNIVQGTVNTSSYGDIEMEQDYLDDLYRQHLKWDHVERGQFEASDSED